MSRRTNLLVALALSLSAAPACDEAIEGDFGGDDIGFRPGFGGSGLYLNTNALGDHPLHELNRLGALHENVELKVVYIRIFYKEQWMLFPLDEVWAEKGQIYGRRGKLIYKGADFIGSQWHVNTYGGGLANRIMFIEKYRFDNADQLHKYVFTYPSDPAYGVHFYNKEQKPVPKDEKVKTLPACVTDASEGGLEAVVYENLHVDMTSGDVEGMKDILNLACLSGGVGKAALFGYPFYAVGEKVFESAVRMIRADYLGNGDSYTMAGTPIDVKDIFGTNTFFDPTSKTEAIWSPKGALCIEAPRRPEFTHEDIVGEGIAPCKGNELGDFAEGIIWTKTPI